MGHDLRSLCVQRSLVAAELHIAVVVQVERKAPGIKLSFADDTIPSHDCDGVRHDVVDQRLLHVGQRAPAGGDQSLPVGPTWVGTATPSVIEQKVHMPRQVSGLGWEGLQRTCFGIHQATPVSALHGPVGCEGPCSDLWRMREKFAEHLLVHRIKAKT